MNQADRFYRVAQWIPRTLWRPFAGLHVEGLSNIPATGPFLLICNHQSNLDPVFLQAVCPRPVHSMAKSSQFAVPGLGWLMKRLLAFPVRRYQTDAQAVRMALRRLANGNGVVIYIEGERSWDGHLQPPRIGTVHLILKAGVPVIPASIAGSYHAWPRWHRGIQLQPVRITFGPPMTFPRIDSRTDRHAFVNEAAATIMGTLGRQLERELPAPIPSPTRPT